jgi:hypothetical protein
LGLPSGNATKVSDFEGWFYLAPTPLIQNVVIQGVIQGTSTTVTVSGSGASAGPGVTVTVTSFAAAFPTEVSRLEEAKARSASIPPVGEIIVRPGVVISSGNNTLSSVQAVITLSYPPIANTTVNLWFSTAAGTAGTGAVAINATATIPTGQTTVTVPITFPNQQAAAATTYTLNATIGTAFQNIPVGLPPTLGVTVNVVKL